MRHTENLELASRGQMEWENWSGESGTSHGEQYKDNPKSSKKLQVEIRVRKDKAAVFTLQCQLETVLRLMIHH